MLSHGNKIEECRVRLCACVCCMDGCGINAKNLVKVYLSDGDVSERNAHLRIYGENGENKII